MSMNYSRLYFGRIFGLLAGALLLLQPSSVSAASPDVPSLDELSGGWNATSELRSLPEVTSPRGAAKSTCNILAVDNIGFPPIFVSGAAGIMKINGAEVKADRVRWSPYQVLRSATASKAIEIETTVQLAASENAVLYHVTLRNESMRSLSKSALGHCLLL